MYDDVPSFLKEFLMYMQNIKNRSNATVKEYHYDLRFAFRFLKLRKQDRIEFTKIDNEMIEETDITMLDLKFLKKIELTDLYEYLDYLTTICSDKPTTRARKIAAIKSFFNFMTYKQKALDKNLL